MTTQLDEALAILEEARSKKRVRKTYDTGMRLQDAVRGFRGIRGIYCIKCLTTGKRYVGQSVDIGRRINDHIDVARSVDDNRLMYRDMREFGLDSFRVSVLQRIVKADTLTIAERRWIRTYHTTDAQSGYNIQYPTNASRKWQPRPVIVTPGWERLTSREVQHRMRQQRSFNEYCDACVPDTGPVNMQYEDGTPNYKEIAYQQTLPYLYKKRSRGSYCKSPDSEESLT